METFSRPIGAKRRMEKRAWDMSAFIVCMSVCHEHLLHTLALGYGGPGGPEYPKVVSSFAFLLRLSSRVLRHG